MLLVIEPWDFLGCDFIQGFLGLFGLVALYEQRVGQQIECSWA